ncbi:sulfite oxidase subunit YedY [Klebsiella variicola]|uniref:Sulfite oxidase subunit YedY n=1 Tax=Klebsiella variicola TaxID=244366 RepID=A0A7H4M8J6_KLEVA|nr:sulfite oxidase subunit YedY [Klebsiella variicola]
MKRKKLTEADVTAESVFMLKRRQVLKMLGISATALSLPPPRRPICWTGLKEMTAAGPGGQGPGLC